MNHVLFCHVWKRITFDLSPKELSAIKKTRRDRLHRWADEEQEIDREILKIYHWQIPLILVLRQLSLWSLPVQEPPYRTALGELFEKGEVKIIIWVYFRVNITSIPTKMYQYQRSWSVLCDCDIKLRYRFNDTWSFSILWIFLYLCTCTKNRIFIPDPRNLVHGPNILFYGLRPCWFRSEIPFCTKFTAVLLSMSFVLFRDGETRTTQPFCGSSPNRFTGGIASANKPVQQMFDLLDNTSDGINIHARY